MKVSKLLLGLGVLLCLFAPISSSSALLLGLILAVTLGNPFYQYTKQATHRLLAIAIIGLGCGMNLHVVARVGFEGLGYTIAGIAFTFLFGTFLGKILKVEKDTSLLISTGTAICGGSAIAAVASAIRPKDHETTVALATVFCLNAIGLIVFPIVGHALGLDQNQFGLWSALAIHDTSSVVGATRDYGDLALKVGTTVKLARALWIVPLTLCIGLLRAHTSSVGKLKKPWFILGFLLAASIMTLFPQLNWYGHHIETGAKRLMVLTLFFIGANLSPQTLKTVGFRPFFMGIILWLVVATVVLGAISFGIVR